MGTLIVAGGVVWLIWAFPLVALFIFIVIGMALSGKGD